jgi:hypothetical protein
MTGRSETSARISPGYEEARALYDENRPSGRSIRAYRAIPPAEHKTNHAARIATGLISSLSSGNAQAVPARRTAYCFRNGVE